MRTITLLLLFQSLLACRQGGDDARPLAEASVGFTSGNEGCRDNDKTRPVASNIVFQSADGGHTWQDISAGLPEGLEPGDIFTASGEVFLATRDGLLRSTATGTPEWEQTQFLFEGITEVYPGRSGLYACSYGKGLFQHMPGIDIWRTLTDALEDKTVHTVLETPDGTLFVGCDSGIFKSADNGFSWRQVFAGGMILDILASGDTLIGGGERGVLRSTDGGEHWTSVLDANILVKKTRLVRDRFVAVLGTRDPSVINPEGITSRLRTSSDGGQTWHRIEHIPLPVQSTSDMDIRLAMVKDVYDIVQSGEYLFCSFDAGVFRSRDRGRSWELVLASDGQNVFSLAVSGKVVYALRRGAGC